jgi:hypothetical protein
MVVISKKSLCFMSKTSAIALVFLLKYVTKHSNPLPPSLFFFNKNDIIIYLGKSNPSKYNTTRRIKIGGRKVPYTPYLPLPHRKSGGSKRITSSHFPNQEKEVHQIASRNWKQTSIFFYFQARDTLQNIQIETQGLYKTLVHK